MAHVGEIDRRPLRRDMQIVATPNAWTWGRTCTVQHAVTIRYVEHIVDKPPSEIGLTNKILFVQ